MESLLRVREQIKNIYAKYEVYITPAIKFLVAFITLLMINKNTGYMGMIGSVAIVLVVALMCSFLPYNFIILFSTIFVLAHFYSLSMEIAIFGVCIFLLLYLLYFRFSPKDTFVVLLMPLCFMLKIPFVIPIAMGLLATPSSMVSTGFGVIVYYMIRFVKVNEAAIRAMDPDGTFTKFRFVVDGILGNKAMIVMILAVAVTITVVYMIRRLSIDYAWPIAIVTGALMHMVVLLMGDLVYVTNVSLAPTFFGMIVSVVLAFVLNFFFFNVDYSRAEKVQFEDDEYYYYVKAVPKNIVRTKDGAKSHQAAPSNMQRRPQTANATRRPVSRNISEGNPAGVVRNQTMPRTTAGTTRTVPRQVQREMTGSAERTVRDEK